MRLGTLMQTAVAVTLLAGAWAARPTPAAAAATQPNIIVIMADDQDDEDSIQHMPALQKLAARGVRFTNSFVDFSLCCPSRASFLTGQAAHNDGIEGNKAPNGGWLKLKPTIANSLGAWMQNAGYRTAMMGKFINGYAEDVPTAIPPGWDEWDVLADRNGPYRYYRYTLNENGTPVSYGHSAYDYQTDVIAAKGDAFIRSSSGPFFLVMEPIAPHGTQSDDVDGASPKGYPEPAPRDVGVFDTLPFKHSGNLNEANVSDKPQAFQVRVPTLADVAVMEGSFRHRREAMLAFDDMITRTVNALTETGKLDNTIIIVTSDNGYSEGSHRFQGKVVLYEESIRVPLVMAGPGIPQGQTRAQMVNNLDMVASIVEWSGARPGRTLDGHALTPILQDDSAPWRTALLVENKNEQAVRTTNWLYGESNTTVYGFEPELYSFSKDPLEMRSVAHVPKTSYQTVEEKLSKTLTVLRNCSGASCWVTAPMPGPPAG